MPDCAHNEKANMVIREEADIKKAESRNDLQSDSGSVVIPLHSELQLVQVLLVQQEDYLPWTAAEEDRH
jgi:hypothetical protein